MTQSLSFTGKRWQLQKGAENPLNASQVLAALYAQRRIDPTKESRLTSPAAFPDMPRAVSRIRAAIEHREHVALFGDYDCDGVTATAILTRFFRRAGTKPHIRLPHRVEDGYGLNEMIVQEFIDAGINLLITADTGITAIEEIRMLREHGIDTIVTDHHHLQEELPQAIALLHPGLSEQQPLPHPSGAGMALQLIRALEENRWNGIVEDCALAMIGTVADLVELRGDNRIIVQKGLKALEQLADEGDTPLGQMVMRSVKEGKNLTSTDIGFRIAPRINAAGRMDDPTLALTAILEGGDALAALDAMNADRQEQTRTFVQEVVDQFEGQPLPPLLCATSTEYPHGIVGLIAGKLTEQFGRPSFVGTIEGDVCTASLRSPPTYNITEGLTRAANLLGRFGGHAQAAGCTMKTDNLSALQTRLNADIADHVPEELLAPTLIVDAVLDASDVTTAFCEQLSELEPFGQGNPEPRFILKGILLENPRRVGADSSHLQGKICGIKAIGFGLGELLNNMNNNVDVVVRIGIDEWNGRRSPQLFVEDVGAVVTDKSSVERMNSRVA